MKRLIRTIMITLLSFDPVIWLYLKLRDKSPRIIVYHGVSGRENEKRSSQVIAYGIFREQMAYLRKYYVNVPLDELIQARAEGRALPRNAITITFDDGYENNYRFAVPVLRENGFSATFFVNPKHVEMAAKGQKIVLWWDVIDYLMKKENFRDFADIFQSCGIPVHNRRDFKKAKVEMEEKLKLIGAEQVESIVSSMKNRFSEEIFNMPVPIIMDWDILKTMKKSGMLIGSHTMSHVNSASLPRDRYHQEFVESKHILKKQLGDEIDTFAFPFGGAAHYSPGSLQAVKDAKYKCALLVLSAKDEENDPFCLNRTAIQKDDNFNTFKVKTSGIYDDLKIWFRRVISLRPARGKK